MTSTLRSGKHKKRNWQFVEVSQRDLRFFRLILEQKFLRRPEVIKNVFGGMKSYAETRIQKLKRFGYIRGVLTKAHEPESYLLGDRGVEALRRDGYVIGSLGFGVKFGVTLPEPQDEIELASYEHDTKVTQVRFLFERLGLSTDWHSEKFLKMGRRGEQKVPDGYLTRNGRGIAVELECHPKKARRYRRILQIYDADPKIHYIFYICEKLSLMQTVMRLAAKHAPSKKYCFMLFHDLMKEGREAHVQVPLKGSFKLKALLQ